MSKVLSCVIERQDMLRPDLVTDGKTLKALRRKRGLTQEELASAMQLEVRSIQRWEAGAVKPHRRNIRNLNDRLQKIDLCQHPLYHLLLGQDGAVAILDGFANYQHANNEFESLTRQFGYQNLEGLYAGDVFKFWRIDIPRITSVDPRALVCSNINSVEYSVRDHINGMQVPLRHHVFVVRQKSFATMLVHEVYAAPLEDCNYCHPQVSKRTNPLNST